MISCFLVFVKMRLVRTRSAKVASASGRSVVSYGRKVTGRGRLLLLLDNHSLDGRGLGVEVANELVVEKGRLDAGRYGHYQVSKRVAKFSGKLESSLVRFLAHDFLDSPCQQRFF